MIEREDGPRVGLLCARIIVPFCFGSAVVLSSRMTHRAYCLVFGPMGLGIITLKHIEDQ
jgi:hypothetical protein